MFTDAFVPVLSNDWANETGSAFEATQVPSTSAISVETGSREKGPKVSSISSEIHVVPPAPRSKQPPAAAEPEAQGEDEEITVVDPELEEDAGQRKDRPIQVCPICQQQFYTNLSMTEHMRTHSQDAGVTCEHVLPIPQDITVWVRELHMLKSFRIERHLRSSINWLYFISARSGSVAGSY